ncbi:hypothetical protein [Dulcicalothrix desertica]|uniref:hypothetical protein n=1 Tax=Dulcicalothrix desertica TaxID=32056 RepID=UPI000F8EF875|nr:hypothetical protein [Dulcicalothrix desertica]
MSLRTDTTVLAPLQASTTSSKLEQNYCKRIPNGNSCRSMKTDNQRTKLPIFKTFVIFPAPPHEQGGWHQSQV